VLFTVFYAATDDAPYDSSNGSGDRLGVWLTALIVVGSVVAVLYLYCMASLCVVYRRSRRATKKPRPVAIYELQDAYDEDEDLEEIYNVLNIFD